MTTKQRYTAETIKCRPINKDALDKTINKIMYAKNPNPAIIYRTSGVHAIINKPKRCLIDDEFVGHEIGEKIIWYVYVTEIHEDGSRLHSCLPEHEVTTTIQEIKQYLMPETSLAEFTKGRRGYNHRIKANEADWIQFFNS